MKQRKTRTAALALAGAVLAAGCSAGGGAGSTEAGGDFGPAEAAFEADRLYQIVNESTRIEFELQGLERRVARKCMEDLGFRVHAPELEAEPYEPRQYTDYMAYAPDFAVPTVEDAERWGFGLWASSIWSTGDEDLAAELITPEVEAEFDVTAESTGEPEYAWDSQDEAYQAEWIEAYTGSPAVTGGLKGAERDSDAELGGCELETIETMYGEPTKYDSGEDAEEEGGPSWTSHPPSPALALELDPGGDAAGWRNVLDGEDTAFLDCITGRGYEEWDFTDDALNMPLWQYFGRMYEPDNPHLEADDGSGAPPVPEDAPTGFTDVMALEITMATDFAECGEESGLRAAVEYGWALELIDAYRPIETEMVGWQSDMQDHIDNAQEYLGA